MSLGREMVRMGRSGGFEGLGRWMEVCIYVDTYMRA